MAGPEDDPPKVLSLSRARKTRARAARRATADANAAKHGRPKAQARAEDAAAARDAARLEAHRRDPAPPGDDA